MLDVTVKTLDGKNRTFSVPDDVTVRQFKEKIATSIEIEADVQRLIFQGRVLADEKKINDYDVNGKTIHVVQRPPPQARAQAASSDGAGTSRGPERDDRVHHEANSFVLGSFSLPGEASDPTHVQNMFQQMFSGIGNLSGRGSRMTSHTSADGTSSMDVHINMTSDQQPQSDSQNRINQARLMLTSAKETLDKLENSAATESSETPMDLSSDSRPTTDSQSSEQQRSATGASNSQPSQGAATSEGSTASAPQDPSPVVLADLLDDVVTLNERLQHHVIGFRQLMRNDPDFHGNNEELRRSQRVCELTSETMHYMSHVYHNLSDLVIDWNQPPPRRLRASPVPAHQATAFIQQTIPVQVSAQINLAHVPTDSIPRSEPASSATTSTNGTSTAAGSATTAATQTGASVSQAARPAAASTTASPSANVSGNATSGGLPRFHINLSGGGGGMPPPFAIPRPPAGAFHMFMEMSPDGNMGNPPNTSSGNPTQTQQSTTAPTTADSSSSSGPGPANTSFPRPPTDGGIGFPPGDFFQNIIQMATGAALRGQPSQQVFMMSPQGTLQQVNVNNGTSARTSASRRSQSSDRASSSRSSSGSRASAAASGAATSNAAPSSENSRGRSRNATARSQNEARNNIFGDGGFPSLGQSVDPYLSCHSRHFQSRRTNQPNANSANNVEQSLAGLVSNLVSSLVSPGSPANVENVETSSSGGESSGLNLGANPLSNPFASLFGGQIPQMASRNAQPRASDPAGSSTTAAGNPSDQVFARLIQGVGAQLSQAAFGQPAQAGTISQFLESLGSEFNISQGEGLITDLFNCITRHLAFTDLMMIFFGQSQPLNRLREPLQAFVRENVLNGQSATDENIALATDRLIRNMQTDINDTAAVAPSLENVDFAASLTSFMRASLTSMINLISRSTDNLTFGQQLFEQSRSAIHNCVNLSRYCLQGGISAIDGLILNRLRVVTSDVNPMIQSWMMEMAVQQLHQMLPSIRMRDEDIQQYVVRQQSPPTVATATTKSEQLSPNSSASYESATGGADFFVDPTDQMKTEQKDVEKMEEDEADSGENVSDLTSDDGLPVNQPRISAEILARLPPPPARGEEANVEVVYGSEDWHSVVPRDWVPVISRDAVRQRRQGSQSPLSDAYLSGMPSKRRKVMMRDRMQEEFADVRVALPETIRRAAQQAGAQPVTSMAELSADVSSNSTLCTAFQQEINETIRQRIANDPEYVPEKYPNTEKYFNSKKP